MCPDAARATLGILRQLGRTVEVLDNACCGLPAATYGDLAAARRLAEQNLRRFETCPADLIVTDCSSCAAFLKKYPALFDAGDARHAAAAGCAARVRDLVELLPEMPAAADGGPAAAREGLPLGAGQQRLVVTYHDPCHAARGQGLVREPRQILRSLPGVEYREMPEADWCCGGAGSYALSHYDLAQKVLDRKIDNLERSGANLLVTSCPACVVHLRHGIRRRGLDVRVCHIAEIVGGCRSRVDS
jgi:glycolate oxidase iron-sulfur subunit